MAVPFFLQLVIRTSHSLSSNGIFNIIVDRIPEGNSFCRAVFLFSDCSNLQTHSREQQFANKRRVFFCSRTVFRKSGASLFNELNSNQIRAVYVELLLISCSMIVAPSILCGFKSRLKIVAGHGWYRGENVTSSLQNDSNDISTCASTPFDGVAFDWVTSIDRMTLMPIKLFHNSG